MLFKNATIICIKQELQFDFEQGLNNLLEKEKFKPCTGLQPYSIGWHEVLKHGKMLAFCTNGKYMLCMKREEKVLPSSVVNAELAKRVNAIEEAEGMAVKRKRRNEIRDQVIAELLPKAFSNESKVYGYIDKKNGWIVIDSASTGRVNEFLALLRRCFESLLVTLFRVKNRSKTVLTGLINSDVTSDFFTIGKDCKLKSTSHDDDAVIQCKNQDLQTDEILNHLDCEKKVISLRMAANERASFTIGMDLKLKRIKWDNAVQEALMETECEDEAARFDADFAIMAGEFEEIIKNLATLFGGMVEEK